MGRKVEGYLNFSSTGTRLESPKLAAINTCFIKQVRPGALCDRHRCHAPGLSIDVADEDTSAFGSMAVGKRRISRTWRVSRHGTEA